LAEIRALRAEVAALRTENNSGNMTLARHVQKPADILDRVTLNGAAMQTEPAA
jgi:hypothetical protein